MKPIRLETTSVDGTKINLEALYQIAPSCFTEEKDEKTGEIKRVVNFETLRQLLGGDAVDEDEEMYQFTWPGKRAARYEAAEPIDDTLRPVPADSVDWDTTENLYIEGDNLRVLKLLQRGYMGKVKMIYIDPPYNTGNDFVYHDDFAHSAEEEDLAAGNIDEEGYRYRRNLDSNGRFHSDWCSMMYSRLLVAHSLLKEDGVIFISIDDNEVHNLRKICDEVFGERNFVANICHKSRASVSNDRIISENHNHILFYSKSFEDIFALKAEIGEDPILNGFNLKDENGEYRLTPVDGPGGAKKGNPYYEFLGVSGYWRYSLQTMTEKYNQGLIVKTVNNLQQKFYRHDAEKTRRTVTTWWDNDFLTSNATRELISLMGAKVFDSPKNINVLLRMLKMFTHFDKDSLILDFFSGSATTAHAVMQLNAEDGGKRKYICVQLPEETPEGSEARKAGYATIPEIAKERIRRAGRKIKEESPLTTQDLDMGFRVFRIDSGNYKNVTMQPNEYDQQMLDLFVDNIKADLDLLFGAMLAWGVQLSLPMTTEEVDGCKIYAVDGNGLVACFAENISENVVQAMAAKQPLRVLFRDSCFDEDKTKINIFERFKQQLDWDEKEAIQSIRVV